ncbi:DUF805 domain-containing protein [Vibrio breoganii]
MKIFSFSGRAPRLHYWIMVTFNISIIIALRLIFKNMHEAHSFASYGLDSAPGIIALTILIAMVWWSVATQVRRLHDLDKNGWWCALNLIPYAGSIGMTIYLGFIKGTDGKNRFGH